MDLRKTAISEQFSPNSKVVSGFGIGLVVSLLLFSLVLINNPFQNSSLNDGGGSYASFSWFFPQSDAAVSASSPPESVSVREERVIERNHTGNLATEDRNAGVLSSSVGDGTQEGSSSRNLDRGSFLDGKEQEMEKTGLGNISETVKDANFSISWDLLRDNIPEGNVSRNSGKGSSVDKEERPMEASKGGSSLAAGEGEVTREGNFSSNLMKGNPLTGVQMMNDTTHEGKSPPETKKNPSISKDNVFQSDKRNKTLEENLSKEAKENGSEFANVFPPPQVGRGIPRKCDIFNGRWVRDEGKPLYPAGSCPHIDRDFDCRTNGRPDEYFLKWRWQPNDCSIPSMNATDFLERLRGKRLLFVGDSLNRNMWESLVCILRHSVLNKKRVHEASGRHEFKTKGYFSFRYEDYDCSIDFVQSPFLVMPSSTKRKEGEHETLRLDLMDNVAPACKGADILVFNTGHWWTHEKTSKGIDYYQEGNYVHPTLNVLEAYEKALKTWAKWIDKNIDAHKTRVFFRGYSLTHFSGGQWNSGGQCHNETEPIFNESYLVSYPSKMRMLEHVLDRMKTPVAYLNISRLTDYRKDGHPSIFRKAYKTDHHTQDCSHWCLPGVPDAWNELLYASLVMSS